MSSITKITKMYFSTLFNIQIIICLGVLSLHLLISWAVVHLVHAPGPAGSNDIIVMFWIFIMALTIFTPSFKYVLSQGITRKKFFSAMSLNIVLLAAAFALLSTLFYAASLKVANVWMVYEMIYRDQAILNMLVWEFALLLFLGMLGWFMRLVYYVSDRNAKLIVTIAPFVLTSLLIFFNILADGGIGRALLDFLKAVMGLSSASPNPYVGAASFLAAAVILSAPVYLMLRRAQVKD
jgi:hypothetical protein